MSYNTLVYRRQGGTAMVVASGGKIVMQTGAQLVPNSESQAAHIANVSTTTVAWSAPDKAKINTLLAALRGVGILATS